MTNTLTVATRGGGLAIAQTKIVVGLLRKFYPDIRIKIKTITTTGDQDRRTTLWKLKTTGFFTSQVEDAILAGEADFAVHSFKDLPTCQRQGLSIAAVCKRQFAEDCLLATGKLINSSRIGTSSLRRAVQIKRLRPAVSVVAIRGNVPTRIRQLEEGKFDAIILARAGMERLALGEKIAISFDPKQFIPAAAQGALAVQTRTEDTETANLIAAINDRKTNIATSAERQVLEMMQCGCHAPAGVFAEIVGDDIVIEAFISDAEGENFIRRRIAGPVAQAQKLAETIANELLEAGGKEILEKLQR